jgi:hypothetical protein
MIEFMDELTTDATRLDAITCECNAITLKIRHLELGHEKGRAWLDNITGLGYG